MSSNLNILWLVRYPHSVETQQLTAPVQQPLPSQLSTYRIQTLDLTESRL